MDKKEYAEVSRKLRVPQRCPLVGYCQRWAWTVYLYSYYDGGGVTDIQRVLKETGALPADYEDKNVTLAVEPPEYTRCDGCEHISGCNLCPEVPLFDRSHTPSMIPAEAISSFLWERDTGIERIETKHFSQCLEFIQHAGVRHVKKRDPIGKKLRFQVFRRDNFTCRYCGRSPFRDGVTLHVDHKVSVNDGGKTVLENLVTSCSDCNFGKSGTSVNDALVVQS
jgi:5-methylcytosine-specific restriction endonuclease McrA